MVEVALRRGRRTEAGRLAAAVEYAEMGWPVCPGAVPRDDGNRLLRSSLLPRSVARDTGRACSCDRIGCPAPGAHPVSAAWQIEASSDPDEVARCWRERPEAHIILVTGRVFDVLDVRRLRGQPPWSGWTAPRQPQARSRSPPTTGPFSLSPPWRARRRGRMVVVPPGLRARQFRPGGRAALALPGRLVRPGPRWPWLRRAVDKGSEGASAAGRTAAARVPGRRLRRGPVTRVLR